MPFIVTYADFISDLPRLVDVIFSNPGRVTRAPVLSYIQLIAANSSEEESWLAAIIEFTPSGCWRKAIGVVGGEAL